MNTILESRASRKLLDRKCRISRNVLIVIMIFKLVQPLKAVKIAIILRNTDDIRWVSIEFRVHTSSVGVVFWKLLFCFFNLGDFKRFIFEENLFQTCDTITAIIEHLLRGPLKQVHYPKIEQTSQIIRDNIVAIGCALLNLITINWNLP